MRPVTGKTNPRKPQAQVSIQCELDGHSFSCAHVATAKAAKANERGERVVERGEVVTECAERAEVVVEVLTARTILLPAELFAEADAALWMAAEGKSLRADETPVHTAPRNGLVALMALPTAALEQLRTEFGADTSFVFTSPLTEIDDLHTAAWHLTMRGGYLYALIVRQGVQLAEVVAAPAEADTLWLIDHLSRHIPTESYLLSLRGDALTKQRKEIAKRFKFKKIQCA